MFERVDPLRPYTTPSRGYQGDAGYDLYSAENITLPPGTTIGIRTNTRCHFPYGWFGLIQERSSIAMNGLHTIGNVIDGEYHGEICFIAHNTNKHTRHITIGQRIAQLVLLRRWVDIDENLLPHRQTNGFGSTGK